MPNNENITSGGEIFTEPIPSNLVFPLQNN